MRRPSTFGRYLPSLMADATNDNSLALYCDFENIALGVRDANYQKFNMEHILERLLVKGSIVVKKAYCDWQRYKDFKPAMHEANFELIDIPHVRQSGKNSADIRMVVDALDLSYTKAHVDTFVIISGDSDFSPLVSKLRENAKTVIGVGVKNSTSDLLISCCDDFIYYDDLVREIERKGKKPSRKRNKKRASRASKGNDSSAETGENAESSPQEGDESTTESQKRGRSRNRQEVDTDLDPGIDDALTDDATADDLSQADDLAQEGIDLVVEVAQALTAERGGSDKLWGSMVKQTLKRRRPGFSESYYGFESFSKMLEEAASRGFLVLDLDDRSGGYIIRTVNS